MSFTVIEYGSTFHPDGSVSSGYRADRPLCYAGECGHHADEHLLAGADAPADPGARFECAHAGCACRDFTRAPQRRR